MPLPPRGLMRGDWWTTERGQPDNSSERPPGEPSAQLNGLVGRTENIHFSGRSLSAIWTDETSAFSREGARQMARGIDDQVLRGLARMSNNSTFGTVSTGSAISLEQIVRTARMLSEANRPTHMYVLPQGDNNTAIWPSPVAEWVTENAHSTHNQLTRNQLNSAGIPPAHSLTRRTDMKEKLAEKITSAEQLLKVYGESRLGYMAMSDCLHAVGAHTVVYNGTNYRGTPTWWLYREYARLRDGVYEQSNVLAGICKGAWAGHMVPHISKDDPKMIAYTATPEDGIRDKQTKTTIGRFIRKYFPLMTDEYVQFLEQEHNAEVCAEVHFATTRDDIRRVYTTMEGDSGCMRHSNPAYFNIVNDIHPSAVYEAPGVSVAYTKTENGKIKSRAVVFVNPDNPNDKRYVRIYGAPVLRRLLERDGYRCDDLHGARLRRIPRVTSLSSPAEEGMYVMPYLDGPGGNQDAGNPYIVDEGEADWLRVCERDIALRIRNAVGEQYVPIAKSTAACVYVLPKPAAKFVSGLTGAEHDRYASEMAYAVKDGRVVQATGAEVHEHIKTCVLRYAYDDTGTLVAAWGDANIGHFYHANTSFWDTDANREKCGYVKLSPKFYPGNNAWVTSADTAIVQVDGESHIVSKEDCISVMTQTDGFELIHNSAALEYRKQGHINCANLSGGKAMIHKSNAQLRRTRGGTVFHAVRHSARFIRVYTGEWVTLTEAKRFRVYEYPFYRASNETDEHAINNIPLDALVKKIKTHVRMHDVASMMDNFSVDGCTVEEVDAVLAIIDEAFMRMHNERIGYTLTKIQRNGADTYDYSYKYSANIDLLFAPLGFGCEIDPTYKRGVEAVKFIYDEFTAPLLNFKAQLEAEAAGQMRIDAVPVVAEQAPEAPVTEAMTAEQNDRVALAA